MGAQGSGYPEILDEPMYTPAEVGRLVDLTPTRVRRWLTGYHYNYRETSRQRPPVVRRPGTSGERYASFLDLVDLLFARNFLEEGISLQKLRKALKETIEITGEPHFARKKFFTDGSNIYLEMRGKGEAILELLSGGQWVITQIIRQLSREIDFDSISDLALRWHPPGYNGLIVIDPQISFGRPSITGKGIDTFNIYDFFSAEGKKIRSAQEWFNLSAPEVRAAVSFEKSLALAA